MKHLGLSGFVLAAGLAFSGAAHADIKASDLALLDVDGSGVNGSREGQGDERVAHLVVLPGAGQSVELQGRRRQAIVPGRSGDLRNERLVGVRNGQDSKSIATGSKWD